MPEAPSIHDLLPGLKTSGRQSIFAHEMASVLSCSIQHVWNLIENKKLRALNIATTTSRASVRILIADAQDYLNKAEYDPLAASPSPKQGELFPE